MEFLIHCQAASRISFNIFSSRRITCCWSPILQDASSIKSRVPQKSVLASLLYLLFIVDISTFNNTTITFEPPKRHIQCFSNRHGIKCSFRLYSLEGPLRLFYPFLVWSQYKNSTLWNLKASGTLQKVANTPESTYYVQRMKFKWRRVR